MSHLRHIMLAILLLIVYGCGSGGNADSPKAENHGYGFEYDAQGAIGLKLRYTPELTTADPLSNPIFFENIFTQVQACVGVTSPAPMVIFVHRGTLGTTPDGLTVYGEYLTAPSLVLLYADLDKVLDIIRHEFIHYLLDVSTGNADAEHCSGVFKPRLYGGCA